MGACLGRPAAAEHGEVLAATGAQERRGAGSTAAASVIGSAIRQDVFVAEGATGGAAAAEGRGAGLALAAEPAAAAADTAPAGRGSGSGRASGDVSTRGRTSGEGSSPDLSRIQSADSPFHILLPRHSPEYAAAAAALAAAAPTTADSLSTEVTLLDPKRTLRAAAAARRSLSPGRNPRRSAEPPLTGGAAARRPPLRAGSFSSQGSRGVHRGGTSGLNSGGGSGTTGGNSTGRVLRYSLEGSGHGGGRHGSNPASAALLSPSGMSCSSSTSNIIVSIGPTVAVGMPITQLQQQAQLQQLQQQAQLHQLQLHHQQLLLALPGPSSTGAGPSAGAVMSSEAGGMMTTGAGSGAGVTSGGSGLSGSSAAVGGIDSGQSTNTASSSSRHRAMLLSAALRQQHQQQQLQQQHLYQQLQQPHQQRQPRQRGGDVPATAAAAAPSLGGARGPGASPEGPTAAFASRAFDAYLTGNVHGPLGDDGGDGSRHGGGMRDHGRLRELGGSGSPASATTTSSSSDDPSPARGRHRWQGNAAGREGGEAMEREQQEARIQHSPQSGGDVSSDNEAVVTSSLESTPLALPRLTPAGSETAPDATAATPAPAGGAVGPAAAASTAAASATAVRGVGALPSTTAAPAPAAGSGAGTGTNNAIGPGTSGPGTGGTSGTAGGSGRLGAKFRERYGTMAAAMGLRTAPDRRSRVGAQSAPAGLRAQLRQAAAAARAAAAAGAGAGGPGGGGAGGVAAGEGAAQQAAAPPVTGGLAVQLRTSPDPGGGGGVGGGSGLQGNMARFSWRRGGGIRGSAAGSGLSHSAALPSPFVSVEAGGGGGRAGADDLRRSGAGGAGGGGGADQQEYEGMVIGDSSGSDGGERESALASRFFGVLGGGVGGAAAMTVVEEGPEGEEMLCETNVMTGAAAEALPAAGAAGGAGTAPAVVASQQRANSGSGGVGAGRVRGGAGVGLSGQPSGGGGAGAAAVPNFGSHVSSIVSTLSWSSTGTSGDDPVAIAAAAAAAAADAAANAAAVAAAHDTAAAAAAAAVAHLSGEMPPPLPQLPPHTTTPQPRLSQLPVQAPQPRAVPACASTVAAPALPLAATFARCSSGRDQPDTPTLAPMFMPCARGPPRTAEAPRVLPTTPPPAQPAAAVSTLTASASLSGGSGYGTSPFARPPGAVPSHLAGEGSGASAVLSHEGGTAGAVNLNSMWSGALVSHLTLTSSLPSGAASSTGGCGGGGSDGGAHVQHRRASGGPVPVPIPAPAAGGRGGVLLSPKRDRSASPAATSSHHPFQTDMRAHVNLLQWQQQQRQLARPLPFAPRASTLQQAGAAATATHLALSPFAPTPPVLAAASGVNVPAAASESAASPALTAAGSGAEAGGGVRRCSDSEAQGPDLVPRGLSMWSGTAVSTLSPTPSSHDLGAGSVLTNSTTVSNTTAAYPSLQPQQAWLQQPGYELGLPDATAIASATAVLSTPTRPAIAPAPIATPSPTSRAAPASPVAAASGTRGTAAAGQRAAAATTHSSSRSGRAHQAPVEIDWTLRTAPVDTAALWALAKAAEEQGGEPQKPEGEGERVGEADDDQQPQQPQQGPHRPSVSGAVRELQKALSAITESTTLPPMTSAARAPLHRAGSSGVANTGAATPSLSHLLAVTGGRAVQRRRGNDLHPGDLGLPLPSDEAAAAAGAAAALPRTTFTFGEPGVTRDPLLNSRRRASVLVVVAARSASLALDSRLGRRANGAAARRVGSGGVVPDGASGRAAEFEAAADEAAAAAGMRVSVARQGRGCSMPELLQHDMDGDTDTGASTAEAQRADDSGGIGAVDIRAAADDARALTRAATTAVFMASGNVASRRYRRRSSLQVGASAGSGASASTSTAVSPRERDVGAGARRAGAEASAGAGAGADAEQASGGAVAVVAPLPAGNSCALRPGTPSRATSPTPHLPSSPGTQPGPGPSPHDDEARAPAAPAAAAAVAVAPGGGHAQRSPAPTDAPPPPEVEAAAGGSRRDSFTGGGGFSGTSEYGLHETDDDDDAIDERLHFSSGDMAMQSPFAAAAAAALASTDSSYSRRLQGRPRHSHVSGRISGLGAGGNMWTPSRSPSPSMLSHSPSPPPPQEQLLPQGEAAAAAARQSAQHHPASLMLQQSKTEQPRMASRLTGEDSLVGAVCGGRRGGGSTILGGAAPPPFLFTLTSSVPGSEVDNLLALVGNVFQVPVVMVAAHLPGTIFVRIDQAAVAGAAAAAAAAATTACAASATAAGAISSEPIVPATAAARRAAAVAEAGAAAAAALVADLEWQMRLGAWAVGSCCLAGGGGAGGGGGGGAAGGTNMAATATAAAGGSSPGDEEGGLGLPDEDEGVVVVEDTVQDTRLAREAFVRIRPPVRFVVAAALEDDRPAAAAAAVFAAPVTGMAGGVDSDGDGDSRAGAGACDVALPGGGSFWCDADEGDGGGRLLGTLCMADFKPRSAATLAPALLANIRQLLLRQLSRDVRLYDERQRSRAVLSELLLSLQRLLDRHNRCLLLVELGAGPGGRWPVLYANHAWTSLTGMPREEVVGRDIKELITTAAASWSTTTSAPTAETAAAAPGQARRTVSTADGGAGGTVGRTSPVSALPPRHHSPCTPRRGSSTAAILSNAGADQPIDWVRFSGAFQGLRDFVVENARLPTAASAAGLGPSGDAAAGAMGAAQQSGLLATLRFRFVAREVAQDSGLLPACWRPLLGAIQERGSGRALLLICPSPPPGAPSPRHTRLVTGTLAAVEGGAVGGPVAGAPAGGAAVVGGGGTYRATRPGGRQVLLTPVLPPPPPAASTAATAGGGGGGGGAAGGLPPSRTASGGIPPAAAGGAGAVGGRTSPVLGGGGGGAVAGAAAAGGSGGLGSSGGPVRGLELRHVLGRGGFGAVHYGLWEGLPVAVKTLDISHSKFSVAGASLEAVMGAALDHPNIVKTLLLVEREREPARPRTVQMAPVAAAAVVPAVRPVAAGPAVAASPPQAQAAEGTTAALRPAVWAASAEKEASARRARAPSPPRLDLSSATPTSGGGGGGSHQASAVRTPPTLGSGAAFGSTAFMSQGLMSTLQSMGTAAATEAVPLQSAGGGGGGAGGAPPSHAPALQAEPRPRPPLAPSSSIGPAPQQPHTVIPLYDRFAGFRTLLRDRDGSIGAAGGVSGPAADGSFGANFFMLGGVGPDASVGAVGDVTAGGLGASVGAGDSAVAGPGGGDASAGGGPWRLAGTPASGTDGGINGGRPLLLNGGGGSGAGGGNTGSGGFLQHGTGSQLRTNGSAATRYTDVTVFSGAHTGGGVSTGAHTVHTTDGGVGRSLPPVAEGQSLHMQSSSVGSGALGSAAVRSGPTRTGSSATRTASGPGGSAAAGPARGSGGFFSCPAANWMPSGGSARRQPGGGDGSGRTRSALTPAQPSPGGSNSVSHLFTGLLNWRGRAPSHAALTAAAAAAAMTEEHDVELADQATPMTAPPAFPVVDVATVFTTTAAPSAPLSRGPSGAGTGAAGALTGGPAGAAATACPRILEGSSNLTLSASGGGSSLGGSRGWTSMTSAQIAAASKLTSASAYRRGAGSGVHTGGGGQGGRDAGGGAGDDQHSGVRQAQAAFPLAAAQVDAATGAAEGAAGASPASPSGLDPRLGHPPHLQLLQQLNKQRVQNGEGCSGPGGAAGWLRRLPSRRPSANVGPGFGGGVGPTTRGEGGDSSGWVGAGVGGGDGSVGGHDGGDNPVSQALRTLAARRRGSGSSRDLASALAPVPAPAPAPAGAQAPSSAPQVLAAAGAPGVHTSRTGAGFADTQVSQARGAPSWPAGSTAMLGLPAATAPATASLTAPAAAASAADAADAAAAATQVAEAQAAAAEAAAQGSTRSSANFSNYDSDSDLMAPALDSPRTAARKERQAKRAAAAADAAKAVAAAAAARDASMGTHHLPLANILSSGGVGGGGGGGGGGFAGGSAGGTSSAAVTGTTGGGGAERSMWPSGGGGVMGGMLPPSGPALFGMPLPGGGMAGGNSPDEIWIVMEYCDLGTLQTALEKGLFAQPPDPASPIHPSGGPAAAAAAATAAAVGGRRSSFAIFSAPVSGTGLAGGPDDGADGAGGGVVGGGGPLGGPLGAPLGGGLGGGLDTRMLSVQMRPRDVDLRALVATALEVASALRYLHALGIMHGDVTGHNVMLVSQDRASLPYNLSYRSRCSSAILTGSPRSGTGGLGTGAFAGGWTAAAGGTGSTAAGTGGGGVAGALLSGSLRAPASEGGADGGGGTGAITPAAAAAAVPGTRHICHALGLSGGGGNASALHSGHSGHSGIGTAAGAGCGGGAVRPSSAYAMPAPARMDSNASSGLPSGGVMQGGADAVGGGTAGSGTHLAAAAAAAMPSPQASVAASSNTSWLPPVAPVSVCRNCGRSFVAKLADFGLSRMLTAQSRIRTRSFGMITFMPPEVLVSGMVSQATDVYSFGVLLWQMYTGQRPWSGMNTGQIVYHVGMKAAQLPFPPASPPQLVALSRACTHPDPRQRCSFTRVNEELVAWAQQLGLELTEAALPAAPAVAAAAPASASAVGSGAAGAGRAPQRQ